jgi:hypothetical protein
MIDLPTDVSVFDPIGVTNDPLMPFLGGALDPIEVQYQFDYHLSEKAIECFNLHLRSIRVVRYKPGRRCLVEYEVEVGGGKPITLIGKARRRGTGLKTYGIQQSLWNSGFGGHGLTEVRVPEPVGVIPKFHMWFQRKVPGTPATSLLAEPGAETLAWRIAEAVYKLHQTRIPTNRRHTIDDELRILRDRLSLVAQLRPEWDNRLNRILEACEKLAAVVPGPKSGNIHRDFYADHVLVDGQNLYLVDFDLHCEGDVGLDIGNFVAHLKEQSLRTIGDPDGLQSVEKALVDRFVELAGEEVYPTIDLYTTLTLVRHIYLSTQFPERRPFIEALMELCQRRLYGDI